MRIPQNTSVSAQSRYQPRFEFIRITRGRTTFGGRGMSRECPRVDALLQAYPLLWTPKQQIQFSAQLKRHHCSSLYTCVFARFDPHSWYPYLFTVTVITTLIERDTISSYNPSSELSKNKKIKKWRRWWREVASLGSSSVNGD